MCQKKFRLKSGFTGPRLVSVGLLASVIIVACPYNRVSGANTYHKVGTEKTRFVDVLSSFLKRTQQGEKISIGTEGKPLSLVIDTVISISRDIEFGEIVKLSFVRGGRLDVARGVRIAIKGEIDAGPWDIFGGGSFDLSYCKVPFIYSQWFLGKDVGDKINRAIQSLNNFRTIPILITVDAWSGKQFNTSILVDRPVRLIFPGIRNNHASFLGSDCAMKIHATGARITGFGVDLGSNKNQHVDGLVLYQANDCIVDGGLFIRSPPRDGIVIDSDGKGAYNNTLYGIIRIQNCGRNGILLTNSHRRNHPNANSFYHCVINNPKNAGVKIEAGYFNHFVDVYMQGRRGPDAWGIIHSGGHNRFTNLTIDHLPNGILVNRSKLNVLWLHNSALKKKLLEINGGMLIK